MTFAKYRHAASCPVCEMHAEIAFTVEGMDCQDEAVALERRVGQLPGVEEVSADVVSQRLQVKFDGARLSAPAIAEAVAQIGLRVRTDPRDPGPRAADSRPGQALVVLSGAALTAGMALQFGGASSSVVLGALGLAIVAGGASTAPRAWSALRALSLDINVLMSVAVVGALAIGQWAEAAAVTFLFALAQQLEARSMERARHAIRALMNQVPGDALVKRGAGEQRVRVEEVGLGETIVVRPGEKIPLDGEVLVGDSQVNQAPITGESLPRHKGRGDTVFAGTINGHGALEIEVTRLQADTTMARIIDLVEVAQAQRAPTQTTVERFARYYTPSVIVLAVAISTLPPLVLGQPFATWFYRALVLLIVSCPCALVISTPVSIVSALAAAARNGVLIKGGIHLERTARLQAIAFDKTGTLTAGQPEVVAVTPLNGVGGAEILRLAAALESRSEHPIASAIARGAAAAGVRGGAVESFLALPGLGAQANVDGQSVLVGNHRLFEQRGLCSPEADRCLDDLARAGRTAVFVARQGSTIGLIGISDQLRESGRECIEELRRQGVKRVVMLTGDNLIAARAIARDLGVDEVHAELLPGDKVRTVADLKRRYGTVAMVGDGVNDAPALAAADVGIAMGVGGTDAALETADVALMADDLAKIPYLVRLSRATLGNVRANIGFSLGLKAAVLACGVAGVATLWMAVAADMGASLLVIANGLRLLRTK